MASHTALCDVNDIRYQVFIIKKGGVDSGQLPPCKVKVPLCFMLCGPVIKKLVWKIHFEQNKNDSNSQEGHGWMIEGSYYLGCLTH